MNQQSRCDNIVVSSRKFCSLTFCKHCQVFQLHIGPLSFRLEQEHCELLCEMMHSVYSQWMRPEVVANEELGSATLVNYKNH